MALELRTHESIGEIAESDWTAVAGPGAPPFVAWRFLDVLEKTGCVRPARGWLPCHLSLRDGETLVAVAPAYIKGNSEGEFVFDQGWARFAIERLALDYYPKLIVAVPFTPANGPRLMVRPGADRERVLHAFAGGLPEVVAKLGVSSAHVLFPREDEAVALAKAGLVERHGLQYHWRNPGYASFDEFLARFDSKHRNQIKRERRGVRDDGLLVETLGPGELGTESVDLLYELYLSTVNKYFWGRQYLNRAFFEEACARLPELLHVVVARDRSSRRAIAGAFNLIGGGALYGRYWGAREERRYLHFEVCFYHGIEECIRHGLSLFEPGAGGEHKVARGFEPTLTRSVHYLADERLHRAVVDFAAREREAIASHLATEPCVLKPRL